MRSRRRTSSSCAEPEPTDWIWIVSVALAAALVGLIAAARAGISLFAMGQPWQWDYGEPVVYGQAARLVHGQALYQPFDTLPLTVTAYTPLYYYAVAGLRVLFGDGFGPGRALSYVSAMVAAACVARLAALAAGSRWAGAIAAVMFIGLAFTGAVPWFALYRVDTLGVALSLAAICVVCDAERRWQLVLAGALAGLALLTKQTFFAAPLASVVWLARRRRAEAALFATATLTVAVVPCLLLQLTTPAFLANTVIANINPLAPGQVIWLLPTFELSLGPPLILAALYALPGNSTREPWFRLILLYWLASAVPLVGLLKFGAFYNYWIEFAAPTVILATVGMWKTAWAYRTLGARILSFVPMWLLILDVAWIAFSGLQDIPDSIALLTSPARRTEFEQLVERVRAQPGLVLAEPMDVLVLADRPVQLEPVIFGILQRQGVWDPTPLVRSICRGEVPLLVLELPLPAAADYAPFGVPWWPEPVIRALQARMTPTDVLAGRQLYVPSSRPASDSASCTLERVVR